MNRTVEFSTFKLFERLDERAVKKHGEDDDDDDERRHIYEYGLI